MVWNGLDQGTSNPGLRGQYAAIFSYFSWFNTPVLNYGSLAGLYRHFLCWWISTICISCVCAEKHLKQEGQIFEWNPNENLQDFENDVEKHFLGNLSLRKTGEEWRTRDDAWGVGGDEGLREGMKECGRGYGVEGRGWRRKWKRSRGIGHFSRLLSLNTWLSSASVNA